MKREHFDSSPINPRQACLVHLLFYYALYQVLKLLKFDFGDPFKTPALTTQPSTIVGNNGA